MKVYIKPWKEASECAKEANNFLVDTSDDDTRILSILSVTRQAGDWGHIVEATKNGEYYIAEGRYPFSYPACCAEEITPEWLEKNATVLIEDIISTDSTANTWDKSLKDYETHRNTIYKATDALHTYFFYAKRVSYNGLEEVVEEFMEIN